MDTLLFIPTLYTELCFGHFGPALVIGPAGITTLGHAQWNE
jgi:hypothetical protein